MINEKCLIKKRGECVIKDETAIVIITSAFTGLITGIAVLSVPVINGIIQSNVIEKNK